MDSIAILKRFRYSVRAIDNVHPYLLLQLRAFDSTMSTIELTPLPVSRMEELQLQVIQPATFDPNISNVTESIIYYGCQIDDFQGLFSMDSRAVIRGEFVVKEDQVNQALTYIKKY